MNESMSGRFERYKALIDDALFASFAPEGDGADGLRRVMRYSLEAGGKRIRPVLCLEFCRVCGGDPARSLPVACGVEMLHTYSLIHDDLPCMDDDDERRGRPSCHKAFGEAAAVLAGDCLQAEAFSSVCRADIGQAERFRCCEILSRAAGVSGICGGQHMDLSGADQKTNTLLAADRGKTAALMGAACAMGAASAGADADAVKAAEDFGAALGMAFQCRDDMLDGDGLCALLGKTACASLAQEYTRKALALLDRFEDTDFLRELTARLCERAA